MANQESSMSSNRNPTPNETSERLSITSSQPSIAHPSSRYERRDTLVRKESQAIVAETKAIVNQYKTNQMKRKKQMDIAAEQKDASEQPSASAPNVKSSARPTMSRSHTRHRASDKLRESLRVRSKVRIYSKQQRKWVKGSIIDIRRDHEGEWLVTKDERGVIREIQRYSEYLRPRRRQSLRNSFVREGEKFWKDILSEFDPDSEDEQHDEPSVTVQPSKYVLAEEKKILHGHAVERSETHSARSSTETEASPEIAQSSHRIDVAQPHAQLIDDSLGKRFEEAKQEIVRAEQRNKSHQPMIAFLKRKVSSQTRVIKEKDQHIKLLLQSIDGLREMMKAHHELKLSSDAMNKERLSWARRKENDLKQKLEWAEQKIMEQQQIIEDMRAIRH